MDDEVIAAHEPIYIIFHKPAGVVCANVDANYPTVMDYLPYDSDILHCAGRLDVDTTGLVLLTDDGQWSHRVTAPSANCQKLYTVTTKWPLHPDTQANFANGLQLNGEDKACLPAKLEQLADCQANLWISEGKYHQVKRMFAACKNRVTKLHREAVGALTLKDDLAEGEWRYLTPEEVQSFYE